jgi:hypothetical protein
MDFVLKLTTKEDHTRTITNLFYFSGVSQGSSRGPILFVLNCLIIQMFQRKLLEGF